MQGFWSPALLKLILKIFYGAPDMQPIYRLPATILILWILLVTDGWADTGDFMGWLYVDEDPWLICSSMGGNYIYCPEGNVSESGAWVYLSK